MCNLSTAPIPSPTKATPGKNMLAGPYALDGRCGFRKANYFFSFFSSLGGKIKTRAVTEDARCRVFQGRELGKPRGQVTCLRSGACEECPGLGSRVGRRRGQLHHRARLLRALLSSYSNLRHATSTIPAKDMRNFIKIIYCFSARSQVL